MCPNNISKYRKMLYSPLKKVSVLPAYKRHWWNRNHSSKSCCNASSVQEASMNHSEAKTSAAAATGCPLLLPSADFNARLPFFHRNLPNLDFWYHLDTPWYSPSPLDNSLFSYFFNFFLFKGFLLSDVFCQNNLACKRKFTQDKRLCIAILHWQRNGKLLSLYSRLDNDGW